MNNKGRGKVQTMKDSTSGLHFCINHTGKMAGMYSVSTSVLENENCKARAKNPRSICSKCYAGKMAKMYKGLEKNLSENTAILTGSIIPVEDLPYINAHSFRLEAFGDLNNTIQVINYFNICRKNKSVKIQNLTVEIRVLGAAAVENLQARPI